MNGNAGRGGKAGSYLPGRGKGISPWQIKVIHTLKGVLGMDEDSYRALLGGLGVKSSKALSWRQAEELIEDLQRKTGSPSPSPARKPLPFSDLDGRPGMATGAQCRLMAAMWGEVSRAGNAAARGKALERFIKRIAGVESIRFVKGYQVEKVVKALEQMKKDKGGTDDQEAI